jgi:hypothetical protein
MKVVVNDHGGCFEISLEAETMSEVASLVRMGMNHTRDLRWTGANVFKDGKTFFGIILGESKRSDSIVPRRK